MFPSAVMSRGCSYWFVSCLRMFHTSLWSIMSAGTNPAIFVCHAFHLHLPPPLVFFLNLLYFTLTFWTNGWGSDNSVKRVKPYIYCMWSLTPSSQLDVQLSLHTLCHIHSRLGALWYKINLVWLAFEQFGVRDRIKAVHKLTLKIKKCQLMNPKCTVHVQLINFDNQRFIFLVTLQKSSSYQVISVDKSLLKTAIRPF